METPSRHLGRLCAVALVGLLVAGAAAPANAAVPASAQSSEGSSFVVALNADGSAELRLTLAYDLRDDDQRAAFESLREDESSRDRVRTRFGNRLTAVAADAENATGREMAVTGAGVELSTADGSTGVVVLSATYEGLAAVDDGRLTVTEPFASGFETDYRFTLRGPEGYRLISVAPEPAAREDGTATWGAGSDLSGFEATFSSGAGGTATAADGSGEATAGGTSSGDGAGFGLLVALLAVGTLGLAVRRRA